MTVAAVDYAKCRTCKNGACPNRQSSAARPDRIAALCNRTCLAHLEDAGRVSNVFEQSFRKRPAWSIDEANRHAEIVPEDVVGGVFRKN